MPAAGRGAVMLNRLPAPVASSEIAVDSGAARLMRFHNTPDCAHSMRAWNAVRAAPRLSADEARSRVCVRGRGCVLCLGGIVFPSRRFLRYVDDISYDSDRSATKNSAALQRSCRASAERVRGSSVWCGFGATN